MFDIRAPQVTAFAGRLGNAQQVVGSEMTQMVDRITIQGEGFAKQILTSNGSVVTGHLRRSVAHRPATFGGGVARGAWGTATPYGPHVEHGRGPIVARGKALRFVPKGGGQAIYRKRVGPARARPFMRPSADRVRPIMGREARAVGGRILTRIVSG